MARTNQPKRQRTFLQWCLHARVKTEPEKNRRRNENRWGEATPHPHCSARTGRQNPRRHRGGRIYQCS
ncbi:unnamed protein product [Penicillium roqueforti FM164]|uniref:Genomic scaffold, ProqFM164S01 n=1 Tax=Penicillium roqueforti (strain FM164) TaxID=1365484 RepID=W6PQC8_PENRF|nr:unnamed protein product [Penicillium roqueforti FM164]